MGQQGTNNNDSAELEIRRKIEAANSRLRYYKDLHERCRDDGAPGFRDTIDQLKGELTGLDAALEALTR